MARKWPADEIPDSSIVPNGVYTVSCSIKETRTKDTDKLMYKGTFSIVEPDAFAGVPQYENFVIGSDNDPDAEDPDTWKAAIGARILKRVFKAAGLPIEDDLDDLLEAVEGQQIVIEVGTEVEDKPGKYKGTTRNKIVSYYPLGERAPGAKAAKAAPAPARAAAPAPRAAAPAAAPKAAAKSSERMLVCTVCDAKVPMSEYGAHVSKHEE